MVEKIWSDAAWEDYLYWQAQDRKTLKRINLLIKDIERNGSNGIGKSEVLRYGSGFSKRIDKENRLVYVFYEDKLWIVSCRGHYED